MGRAHWSRDYPVLCKVENIDKVIQISCKQIYRQYLGLGWDRQGSTEFSIKTLYKKVIDNKCILITLISVFKPLMASMMSHKGVETKKKKHL